LHFGRIVYPEQMDTDYLRNGDSDEDVGDRALLAIGAAIRAALGTGADPYTVAGMAAEGAAYAIARYVPPDERQKAAVALVLIIHDRLKVHGIR
jgi:hypothetical protein